MCGWISAAAVPKNAELLKLFPDMNGTRSAYLFFTILAFLLYLALYIMNLLNIINMDRVRQLPWNLIVRHFNTLIYLVVLLNENFQTFNFHDFIFISKSYDLKIFK